MYLIVKPEQWFNMPLENNYNTASGVISADKIFYSILSTDFREGELWTEEHFGFRLALTIFASSRFAGDYHIL